ncbi:MAG: putative inorganic carbon transporter subunit DabA [Haloarculaceae archaeon]
MAGNRAIDRFFARTFAFTLVVMVLVAAEHLAVFWAAWLGMGLVMAGLVGHVDGWPQAQAAAGLARRYFFASSAALAVALVALWWHTGATTVSGVASAVEAGSAAGTTPATAVLAATGALLLAAMVQSALVPFHMWLLASMTGLPLQSLRSADGEPYHQPLRLSTVIHVPVERVTEVLSDHDELAGLLDNGWLSLTVVDPEQNHRAFHYAGDLAWVPFEERGAGTPEPAATHSVADD